MSPKLKTLAGEDVVQIFAQFGFQIHSQRGSHIKLVRVVEQRREVLTVPRHRELDRGTLRAIFRQASRYISQEALRPYFYTE